MNILIQCNKKNLEKNLVNENEFSELNETVNENDLNESNEIVNEDEFSESNEVEISINEIRYPYEINQQIFTDIEIENNKKFLVNALNTLNQESRIDKSINNNICKNISHILNELCQPNSEFYKDLFYNQID